MTLALFSVGRTARIVRGDAAKVLRKITPGTTGVACAAEGMSFLGIEESKKHHATATRRLERWFGAVGVSL